MRDQPRMRLVAGRRPLKRCRYVVGPVRFCDGLAGVVFDVDGAALSFAAEAERARRDDLKVVVSDYRQPFGTFSGTLPGGLALALALGVMERHEARW